MFKPSMSVHVRPETFDLRMEEKGEDINRHGVLEEIEPVFLPSEVNLGIYSIIHNHQRAPFQRSHSRPFLCPGWRERGW